MSAFFLDMYVFKAKPAIYVINAKPEIILMVALLTLLQQLSPVLNVVTGPLRMHLSFVQNT